jgi:hypothetical protein
MRTFTLQIVLLLWWVISVTFCVGLYYDMEGEYRINPNHYALMPKGETTIATGQEMQGSKELTLTINKIRGDYMDSLLLFFGPWITLVLSVFAVTPSGKKAHSAQAYLAIGLTGFVQCICGASCWYHLHSAAIQDDVLLLNTGIGFLVGLLAGAPVAIAFHKTV